MSAKKYLHFQRKIKLSMVAIFFRKKTCNSQRSFSVFFYACGKKMANYANFAFPLPFRYFLLNFFYAFALWEIAGARWIYGFSGGA